MLTTNHKPATYDPDVTVYIENENGGVHGVTEEHFWERCHEYTNAGNLYLLPGWRQITEDEARRLHPQLFGVPDPQMTYLPHEAQAMIESTRLRAELFGE